MKKINHFKKIVFVLIIASLAACTNESTLTDSQLDVSKPSQSALDVWIEQNYTNPFNIEILYKWNQNTVDNNRYLFPPTQEKIRPALEVVKKIWIDTYTTIGGADFVKKIAPRQFVLIGGVNLNSVGTKTLGLAEGGQRITLFETDYVQKNNYASITMFIHTIQHEYIHILNQNKPFNEKAFEVITPSGYTSNWYQTEDADALEEGFITAYAKSNINEDFAEMASVMLTFKKAEYENTVNSIVSDDAYYAIRKKEALVVKYFKEAFGIDFYKLRDEAEKNTEIVLKS